MLASKCRSGTLTRKRSLVQSTTTTRFFESMYSAESPNKSQRKPPVPARRSCSGSPRRRPPAGVPALPRAWLWNLRHHRPGTWSSCPALYPHRPRIRYETTEPKLARQYAEHLGERKQRPKEQTSASKGGSYWQIEHQHYGAAIGLGD